MDPRPTQKIKAALTRERKVKGLHGLQVIFESFSITEKAIFLASAVVFVLAALSLTNKVSDHFKVDVPAYGGELTEGVIGTPRFINPLLASSDADRDLSALVYSGLLKAEPDGSYVPNLAESYTVSDDGLIYSFIIRSDATFHDGTPVTADDVEFTVLEAQDSALKSPRRVSWEGVTVQKNGTHEISFTLKQPYAPFIGNLTLGILPEHIWKAFQSDQFPFSTYNVSPIGSGPYMISSVQRNADEIPVSYTLEANPHYALGRPYISTLSFKFFANDAALAKALEDKSVESASNFAPSAAESLDDDVRLLKGPFTRVFGVFFNQNSNEILAHKEIRKALDASIDRTDLIDNVLQGFATETDGPLPPISSGAVVHATATDPTALLAKAGWKKNPSTGIYEIKPSKTMASSTFTLSLSTANIPELADAAHHIAEDWKAIGADVDVKVFEPSDLNQSVIRPRKYDALLFGMVTGRNPDLYAFWHSSQRNDPGLNVALYTNGDADALLQAMRKDQNAKDFAADYAKFESEVKLDTPAAFLWSPDFIYAVPAKLKGVELGQITTPSDRFADVEKWFVQGDRIWKVFAR